MTSVLTDAHFNGANHGIITPEGEALLATNIAGFIGLLKEVVENEHDASVYKSECLGLIQELESNAVRLPKRRVLEELEPKEMLLTALYEMPLRVRVLEALDNELSKETRFVNIQVIEHQKIALNAAIRRYNAIFSRGETDPLSAAQKEAAVAAWQAAAITRTPSETPEGTGVVDRTGEIQVS